MAISRDLDAPWAPMMVFFALFSNGIPRLTYWEILLEMLLGMLEFLLFHESTEAKKHVSLIDG